MACMDISVTSGSEQNRECNFDKEVQKKKTIGGETVTQHGFIFPINCQIKSQLQSSFRLKRIQHWLRHCLWAKGITICY